MTIQEAKKFILDIYVNDHNNSVLEAYDQITDRYDYLPRTEKERLEYVKNVVLNDIEFINEVIKNVQMEYKKS